MHFKDDPRVQQLRVQILKYNRLVRDLGLRDHQVPVISLECRNNLLSDCAKGSACAKSDMEDSGPTRVPSKSIDSLDPTGPTWNHIECTNVLSRLACVKAKSRR